LNLLIGSPETLPNITGQVGVPTGGASYTGAFEKRAGNYQAAISTATDFAGNIFFDASKSSSVYKTGAHVQSANLTYQVWLRKA